MTRKKAPKQATKRPTKRMETPAAVYPPGFFTEPARAWKQLQWAGPLTLPAAEATRYVELAKRGRKQAEATGQGWGAGTIVLPNTPLHSAPAWMARAPAGRKRGGAM